MFGITTVKVMTYRTKREEYSNTYWLTGAAPADNAAWMTFQDAFVSAEKNAVADTDKIVRVYGYTTPGNPSVYQYDYEALGQTTITGAMGTGGSGYYKAQGDAAAWIRALCGQNSRGRNKYLRKYFHGHGVTATNPDLMSPTSVSSLGLWATKLTDGTLPGGAKWCNEAGQVGTFPQVSRFSTTRTLKRRGKRPS